MGSTEWLQPLRLVEEWRGAVNPLALAPPLGQLSFRLEDEDDDDNDV